MSVTAEQFNRGAAALRRVAENNSGVTDVDTTLHADEGREGEASPREGLRPEDIIRGLLTVDRETLEGLSTEDLVAIAVELTAMAQSQVTEADRRATYAELIAERAAAFVPALQALGVQGETNWAANYLAHRAVQSQLKVDANNAEQLARELLNPGEADGQFVTAVDAVQSLLTERRSVDQWTPVSRKAEAAEYAVRDEERVGITTAYNRLVNNLIKYVDQGSDTLNVSHLRSHFDAVLKSRLPESLQHIDWDKEWQELNTAWGAWGEIQPTKDQIKTLLQKHFQLYEFNIGNPGAYGIKPPDSVISAFQQAVVERSGYGHSFGEETVRQQVARYYEKRLGLDRQTLKVDDVLVGSGVSELIQFMMRSLDPRTEKALAISPVYPLYTSLAGELGVDLQTVATQAEDGWQIDVQKLEQSITPETKILIINSPNNPTGSIYSEQSLQDIVSLAKKYSLIILSDEIYCDDDFREESSPTSLGRITFDAEVPCIMMGGMSKGSGAAAGFRVGWATKLDTTGKANNVWKAMQQFALARLCSNVPAQYAALPVLEGREDVGPHMRTIYERVNSQREAINQELGLGKLSIVEPVGAYYAFFHVEGVHTAVQEKEFAKQLLLQHRVHIVPGGGFGYTEETGGESGYFRLVFLDYQDNLVEGIRRIRDFADQWADQHPQGNGDLTKTDPNGRPVAGPGIQ